MAEAKDITDHPAMREKRALNRAFSNCFDTPDGQKVLEYLERIYGKRSTLKRSKETKTIDPHASLAAAGAQEVYLDIMMRIEDGRLAQ